MIPKRRDVLDAWWTLFPSDLGLRSRNVEFRGLWGALKRCEIRVFEFFDLSFSHGVTSVFEEMVCFAISCLPDVLTYDNFTSPSTVHMTKWPPVTLSGFHGPWDDLKLLLVVHVVPWPSDGYRVPVTFGLAKWGPNRKSTKLFHQTIVQKPDSYRWCHIFWNNSYWNLPVQFWIKSSNFAAIIGRAIITFR